MNAIKITFVLLPLILFSTITIASTTTTTPTECPPYKPDCGIVWISD